MSWTAEQEYPLSQSHPVIAGEGPESLPVTGAAGKSDRSHVVL